MSVKRGAAPLGHLRRRVITQEAVEPKLPFTFINDLPV